MDIDCIDYRNLHQFSELVRDYLDENPNVQWMYHRFPSLTNYRAQIDEKAAHYPHAFRTVLADTLLQQYAGLELSEATLQHIEALRNPKTFTVTTGHQLNLFTGPLYFIYKIISVINQCNQLRQEFPAFQFVPIYWMATEDHDFEEIQSFRYESNKITWNSSQTGAVGRFVIDASFQATREQFLASIPTGERGDYLRQLFLDAYTDGRTLAEATRHLVHQLFREEGLVIIDGDSPIFKKVLTPYLQKELTASTSFEAVQTTISKFNPYKIQVNPREINLFFLGSGSRERILKNGASFEINATGQKFSSDELLQLAAEQPEIFSPNVLLRPLYQEILLPNLSYIGGGGEIAYWLELKNLFSAFEVPFPIVQLRNSVVNVTAKQDTKRKKLQLDYSDLFLPETTLRKEIAQRLSTINFDFEGQKSLLNQQFEALKEVALQTDPSFTGAVLAQERKQIKGLENLQKRLLVAEKRVHQDSIARSVALQSELFPNNGLQERVANFSWFYMEFGPEGLQRLMHTLDPLSNQFSIIVFA